MKKRTCKILLSIGIAWIFFIFIVMLYNLREVSSTLFFYVLVFGCPAWVLIILSWIKWNSEGKIEVKEPEPKVQETEDYLFE